MRLALACIFTVGLVALNPALAFDEVVYVNQDIVPRLCKGNVYIAKDGSYKTAIPDIGKKVAIQDRTIAPNITAHVMFSNFEDGMLYVVSTRIKDELPKDDSVLEQVAARRNKTIAPYSPGFSDKWTNLKSGQRAYENVILNPVLMGQDNRTVYPLLFGFKQGADIEHPSRLGVHRFIVSNGYFFEFAALLNKNKNLETKDQLVAKGYEWIDTLMRGFQAGKFVSCSDI